MSKISLVKAEPLTSRDLQTIASTLYGRDQFGWQSRLARDLSVQSDRNILQTQISQWTAEGTKRQPPWWLGVPAHLALMSAVKELSRRANDCLDLAETIKLNNLANLPAGLIRAPIHNTDITTD